MKQAGFDTVAINQDIYIFRKVKYVFLTIIHRSQVKSGFDIHIGVR